MERPLLASLLLLAAAAPARAHAWNGLGADLETVVPDGPDALRTVAPEQVLRLTLEAGRGGVPRGTKSRPSPRSVRRPAPACARPPAR